MDKPHEIELLEKFLRVEHTLGKSKEELIERMRVAFLWFAETRIKSKLRTPIDRIASEKATEYVIAAITDEVEDVLQI